MGTQVSCNKRCKVRSWEGDGTCDDENNHCGCNWDGGDCCGFTNDYHHCHDCLCLDDTFVHEDAHCQRNCAVHQWRGDGRCDDDNNVCGCDWDGGDCCGHDPNSDPHKYGYCEQCECRDPLFDTCNGKCEVFSWAGDGNCDDQNNNCGCDWDGGDCCAGMGTVLYCQECSCLDPDFQTACNEPCHEPVWQGDQTCDDENNHCGCNWDGGDCCGTTADYNYDYCTDCDCLDPDNQLTLNEGEVCDVHWRADTHCDPQNNHANCDYDGGDCCGPTEDGEEGRSKYHFCTAEEILPGGDCTCKDPNYGVSESCNTACYVTKWAGDGSCDDQNNTCGCDWDGGDCCGDNRDLQYCSECLCQDPDY